MEGLQRSVSTFRRQGSSGLVWDDKLVSAVLNHGADKADINNKSQQQDAAAAAAAAVPTPLTIERSRSSGGRGYRTGRVPPALEPPSPKVSACGFCGAFGKPNKTRRRPPKSGKRVM